MAMSTCRECGGSVSDMAETCPHCGFRRRGRHQSGGLGFFGVIGAIAVIWLLYVADTDGHIAAPVATQTAKAPPAPAASGLGTMRFSDSLACNGDAVPTKENLGHGCVELQAGQKVVLQFGISASGKMPATDLCVRPADWPPEQGVSDSRESKDCVYISADWFAFDNK